MKADFRISVKDYRRQKNLKILMSRTTFGPRQFWVRMNGEQWPKDGKPVSITKVLVSIRKALVRSA